MDQLYNILTPYIQIKGSNKEIEHGISSLKLQKLIMDADTSFVEKWKGFVCETFKKQPLYEDLILRSLVHFIQKR